MTQRVWGGQVSAGDAYELTEQADNFKIIKLSPDGRRQVAPTPGQGYFDDSHEEVASNEANGVWRRVTWVIPEEHDGWYIFSTFPGRDYPSFDWTDANEFPYAIISPTDGGLSLLLYPVTPGDDYYRIRRILGDHALRYMAESPHRFHPAL